MNRLFILCLGVTLYSCNLEDANIPARADGDTNAGKVTFALPSMTRAQMESTQVYMFSHAADAANDGRFGYRVPGFTCSVQGGVDVMSMEARVGVWDMVLVNADQPDLARLIPPVAGRRMAELPMWQTETGGDGMLRPMPELRTAHIEEQLVTVAGPNEGDASMVRNVAWVKVVVHETSGMDTDPAAVHTVTLGNVPTTLSWEGRLLPDRHNPATGGMSGTVTISEDPVTRIQTSDTLYFMIPAHKGSDWLSSDPADTTTRKLLLSVDFAKQGGGSYVNENVEVPITPKMNRILVLDLYVKARLTIAAEIIDWVDEGWNAEFGSRTNIQVDKTNLAMAAGDAVVFIKSDTDFELDVRDVDESWLSATALGNNKYRITATADDFPFSVANTGVRTSWVDVVANNLTKRIHIRQRPEAGTITVSAPSFWVSPSSGNTTRTITVNSTGPWTLISPAIATVIPGSTSGNGNGSITFSRKSHMGVIQLEEYADYYGNSTFEIRNMRSLEAIPVIAKNLYLEVDNLDVPNASGINTKENTDVVRSLGGSAGFSIVSKPTWVTDAMINPVTQSITLTAPGEPNGERRTGSMTLRHNDDPAYTVTVDVIQDFLVTIPEFDYFVIKFTWIGGGDLDINVQFEDNYNPLTGALLSYNATYSGNNYVGWQGANNPLQYNGKKLLIWGGDNTTGGGETVYFNAPVLNNDPNSPRFIKIVCYAYRNGSPARTTLFAYRGGNMTQSGTNFNNEGGTSLVVPNHTRQQYVPTGGVGGPSTSPYHEKLVEIVYDRIKHTADVTYTGTELNTPILPVPTRALLPMPLMTEEQRQEQEAAMAAKKLELLEFGVTE
jgi:hypothetical protein